MRCRALFISVGVVELHKLPNGSIPAIDRRDELRELRRGVVLGVYGRELFEQLQRL